MLKIIVNCGPCEEWIGPLAPHFFGFTSET